MPRRVEIHSRKRVFDGLFKLDEVQVSYERFDGAMSLTVNRLNLERGDSVAAVIFNTDSRKFVLVNQFRYSTYDKGPGWITETVAGMIDGDESPESAVKREVLEEAGFEVSALAHIATFYLSPGGSSERILLYYAEVDDASRTGEGGGVRSESENIAIVELSPEEARAGLATGEIMDAKTIIGLMWALDRIPE